MDFEEENIEQYEGLKELNDSDFEIAEGEPDIIGWNILNSNGGKIGEVNDLIFDPQTRKVRYIVLDMDGNDQDLEDERKVLIPIGVAELHDQDNEVIIPGITTNMLSSLPPYENCRISPGMELETRNVFEGGSTAPYQHPQFYEHEHFNEDKFYSRGSIAENNSLAVPDNEDPEDTAARAQRVNRIIEKINNKDKGI